MADVGDYTSIGGAVGDRRRTGASAHAAWTEAEWEAAWAPYDETTYRAALAFIRPDDTVLDIGAGDLRFASRAAQRARAVIAIERQAALIAAPYPANLTVICGDALGVPFPSDVTVAVLLMRHCRHFADYVRRLRGIGCTQLITNARWGMAVECVSLTPQPALAAAAPGWYACLCGAVGFKPCSPEQLTAAQLACVTEVGTCPACLRNYLETRSSARFAPCAALSGHGAKRPACRF